MIIDLTVEITPELMARTGASESKAPKGHLGTHFDVMDCMFPLAYTQRKGIVFDVSAAAGGKIGVGPTADRDIGVGGATVNGENGAGGVSAAAGGEIGIDDIALDLVEADMFVAFCTGFLEAEGYGSRRYFAAHPQLSHALIDALIGRGISIIGVDFAGIRRGAEHTPADQRCADRGVFVVENLCNLHAVLQGAPHAFFSANTYPLHITGLTGLPCRVCADVPKRATNTEK